MADTIEREDKRLSPAPFSDERRRKMSEAAKRRKPMSDATRVKIGDAMRRRAATVGAAERRKQQVGGSGSG